MDDEQLPLFGGLSRKIFVKDVAIWYGWINNVTNCKIMILSYLKIFPLPCECKQGRESHIEFFLWDTARNSNKITLLVN